MSRVLVTGGAGFIGSHVVDALIDAGHQVTILDNLSTGKLANVNPKALFVEGDVKYINITPPGTVIYDYVFHLAALARIQPSIDDPVSAHDVNVNGTLEILEYCREVGAKIIFSSSSSIYLGEDLPTDELGAKYPKSPYGMQKLMCEQYIRLYHELYGLEYTILRYFNVYGERQLLEGAYAAVIGILLQAKAEANKLPITNDGNQTRDFTYVKDVAQANLMAMKWQGTFNIGTGESYSINELAEEVGGEIEYIGDRKGEARDTLANNNKALAMGWIPVQNILDWIKQYKESNK
jgi:UDP-glucose 4-epimerase